MKDEVFVLKENFSKNVLCYESSIKDYDSTVIFESWKKEDFNFFEKNEWREGLREPQIAGLFSTLGHLKSNNRESAIIVMPTGTGKTETILSLTVAGKFERTLVIVPSDALREQIKDKFLTFGLLRKFGLIKESILNPKVLVIKQGFKLEEDVEIVEKANILIATPNALNKSNLSLLKRIIRKCTHLIVDEAHHVAAKTWANIKNNFVNKPVIQFTATPYRSDGKRVDGRIIYSYSIESAQKDEYFKKIEFYPVKEYVEKKSDTAIAKKAIELLKSDLDKGYNHILMARVNTIKRAERIYEIYKKYRELSPTLITSKELKKRAIIEDIKKGKHRVIVCVNMLGEGFDLPELKIAALHDVHKSINITLQFTGRFTRVVPDIGNAKFVANIADPKVNEMLEELYNEDADWNKLIKQIGTQRLSVEEDYQKFREQFNNDCKLIDQGLNPKISTTIYSSETQEWNPNNFVKIIDKNSELNEFTVNNDNTLLIFSLKSYASVSWSHSHEIRDIVWSLYISYFNKEKKLLYIHSSNKDGLNNKLANAILKTAKKITGEKVFRAMNGVRRLSFQNVGLNRDRKALRYIMYTGTDTKEAIPQLETRRARKSNIFGKGFENGNKTTIGCSHKGKIWAMDSSNVDNWMHWCDTVGDKILDESINTNEILKTAMRSEPIDRFNSQPVIGIEWPLILLQKNEFNIDFNYKGKKLRFIDSEINIKTGVSTGNKIDFFISSTDDEEFKLYLTLTLKKDGFAITSDQYVQINIGDSRYQLDVFFSDNPPLIYLVNTSVIEGNIIHYTEENYLVPFEKEKIECWDWNGADISVESQRKTKLTHSIQFYTIQKIKKDYDIVFDDDGSGEVADIVAIKNIDDEELIIHFYHCKYCSKKNGEAKPGSRVDDVYQVAGQAIKGVRWVHNEKLFDRLITREKRRLSEDEPTRIDKGDIDELIRLRKVSKFTKFKFSFFIVQPAISKKDASDELLSILGAAETYIQETTGAKLNVITSY